MKVAVLGGGITGLTAAHYLVQEGHEVTVIEKGKSLGGLAQGFKEPEWDWTLDFAYHHLFANDFDIQKFAHEIGFNDIYFSTPRTNSVYKDEDGYKIYPVDSPLDFLKFPLLSTWKKIRAAAVLAALKFLPHFSYYETISAEKFVKKYMGEKMWEVFFQQLFRKKFGKYAGKITASFLWARISKRTQSLGYIKGGFQAFTNYVEKHLTQSGVTIQKGTEIVSLKKTKKGFEINETYYDRVISTLPTAILVQVAQKVLPTAYIAKLQKLSYLHALVLIVESDK
ncbi:FAD-dependent oxidoreductase, partial [Candidatus Woesebacteria bacterium]|nr:FAD-dependent oxidoreductase [Candidatus Woesebacteria bacterium]